MLGLLDYIVINFLWSSKNMMIENLPTRKTSQFIFLWVWMEYRRGKIPENVIRVKILKDAVLTQNSLDAILAQAKLLVPDWILDLKSSSVKSVPELRMISSISMTWPPGASWVTLWVTSWVRPSPQMNCWLGYGRVWALQIWTSLAKFSSVCVGGRRAQGVKMVLLWVKHYSPVFEVVRVIQAAYQSHYTPG